MSRGPVTLMVYSRKNILSYGMIVRKRTSSPCTLTYVSAIYSIFVCLSTSMTRSVRFAYVLKFLLEVVKELKIAIAWLSTGLITSCPTYTASVRSFWYAFSMLISTSRLATIVKVTFVSKSQIRTFRLSSSSILTDSGAFLYHFYLGGLHTLGINSGSTLAYSNRYEVHFVSEIAARLYKAIITHENWIF